MKVRCRRRCSLLAPKENQKGRRCPEGMKAPVGLLSRGPVCKANAACSARQGRSDFDVLHLGGVCSLLPHKREREKRQRFRRAGSDGLRHPASASCLGRHSHLAGRCPNSSSLYPPQAAVVAVANKGCSPLIIPKEKSKRKNASRFAQTGCGAQRPLRALSGTRVLLTAAPTAPPCIRRWRRSSPLHFFLVSPI